jgi:hypothetical protein
MISNTVLKARLVYVSQMLQPSLGCRQRLASEAGLVSAVFACTESEVDAQMSQAERTMLKGVLMPSAQGYPAITMQITCLYLLGRVPNAVSGES